MVCLQTHHTFFPHAMSEGGSSGLSETNIFWRARLQHANSTFDFTDGPIPT